MWMRAATRWFLAGMPLMVGGLAARHLPATGYWLWGLLHSLTAGIGAAGVYALIVGARYRGLEVGWRRRQLLANHEIHWAYTRGFDAGWAAPGQARGDDV